MKEVNTMGTRGPVPNRSNDLSRDRDANRGDRPDITRGVAFPVKIPRANSDWHPIAKMLWRAMKDSGQSAFYQQSDWAYAYHICDELTAHKNRYERSAMMLTALNTAMERLLLTEGDRRRVRIELSEPEPEVPSATLTLMDQYRKALEPEKDVDSGSDESSPEPGTGEAGLQVEEG